MGKRSKKRGNVLFYSVILAGFLALGFFWNYFYKTASLDRTPPSVFNKTAELPLKDEPSSSEGGAYSMAAVGEDVRTMIAEALLDESSIYREMSVAAAPDARAAALDSVNNYSFAFDYRGQRYVVAADYSGGEHCCFGWYIFTLDNGKNLKRISSPAVLADTGNVYPEGKDNLVEKNGNLYLKLIDDRFMYYCGSYQQSPLIWRYFLVSKDSLVQKNEDFKNEFIKAAEDSARELEQYYNTASPASGDDLSAAKCRLFVERAANYIAAGEREKAFEGFEKLYQQLEPMNPYLPAEKRFAAPSEIKADILEKFDGE